MNLPRLYRRRFIPNETIYLKDDIILVNENDLIITKWVTLHPRNDIARGISAYYLDKGIKVSKIYDSNNNVVYWYCDIFQVKTDQIQNSTEDETLQTQGNTVIIEDLLVDIVLYQDGTMRILDIDELSEALEHELITKTTAAYALQTLNHLLNIIYEGRFYSLTQPVDQVELNISLEKS